MNDRRYSEDEAGAIFERAARAQDTGEHRVARTDGMTLDQLQEIGREAGIAPERVAQEARALDAGGRLATRRFFGFPLGVGRTVDLGRQLSDEEWEHLVVDLRETFDAKGRVQTHGSLRQWTNGNLQALLEPTPSGHRLRLRTTNGGARGLMTAGAAVAGFATVMVVAGAVAGEFAEALTSAGSIVLVGLTMFGVGAARLPSWAKTRLRQMERVAGRLAANTPETSD